MIDPDYDLQYEDILDMIEAYSFEGLFTEAVGPDVRLQAEVLLDMHHMGLIDLGVYVDNDYE